MEGNDSPQRCWVPSVLKFQRKGPTSVPRLRGAISGLKPTKGHCQDFLPVGEDWRAERRPLSTRLSFESA